MDSRGCAKGAGLALYRRDRHSGLGLGLRLSSAMRVSRVPMRQNRTLNVNEIVEAAEIDLACPAKSWSAGSSPFASASGLRRRQPQRPIGTRTPPRITGPARVPLPSNLPRKIDVVGVDELARLAVAPREDADAGADVRLDRVPWPSGRKRKVAVNGTMRSFRSCSISVPFVLTNRGRRVGTVRCRSPAEAGLEVVAETDELLAADVTPLKSLMSKARKSQVVQQHVVRCRAQSSPRRHERRRR